MTNEKERETLGRAHQRPPMVECFSCIYYEASNNLTVQSDVCRRYPVFTDTSPEDFCGEWRYAWPEIDPGHEKEWEANLRKDMEVTGQAST